MNSSRNQSRGKDPAASMEISEQRISSVQQMPLALDRTEVTPASLNDNHLVRVVLVDSIKKSGKSRAQIAEEIGYLTGREVTERMLNAFTAESKEDHRWPAELDRAFAVATGDDRILKCRAEAAGYKVIAGADLHLLELGRQYLLRKRSEAELADLERRLEGSDL